MAERTLTQRELNRTLLSRQLLLARAPVDAVEAVRRLVGMQAQQPRPPFIGLWSRLEDFRAEQLAESLRQRRIVRATLMRMTLHLMTTADYLTLRPALQPMLANAYRTTLGERGAGLDIPALCGVVRTTLKREPQTFGQLRTMLGERQPDRDPQALAYAVRTHLPFVQLPTATRWGFDSDPQYATCEEFLGKATGASDPAALVIRYLEGFGPATVADLQQWSGAKGMREHVEALRPRLATYRDERGRELFDAPGAPIADGEEPAPPRLIPDYDNLILSHKERTRIIADEHKPFVYLKAARVRATFLIDGFVAGRWGLDDRKRELVIEPFGRLRKADRDALGGEASDLAEWVGEGGRAPKVRFAAALG